MALALQLALCATHRVCKKKGPCDSREPNFSTLLCEILISARCRVLARWLHQPAWRNLSPPHSQHVETSRICHRHRVHERDLTSQSSGRCIHTRCIPTPHNTTHGWFNALQYLLCDLQAQMLELFNVKVSRWCFPIVLILF